MNGNGWKSWVIGALLGLLIGGGGSAIYGSAQAANVEERLNEKIAKLEARETRSYDTIIRMSDRLARMETQLQNIQRQLER